MHSPCAIRRTVNVVRSGATASSAVGIDEQRKAHQDAQPAIDVRPNKATASPATAMPIVLALTAKPMAAGRHLVGAGERGQDRLRREQIDDRQKRRQPDHEGAQQHPGGVAMHRPSATNPGVGLRVP